jgi:hypothetical protein
MTDVLKIALDRRAELHEEVEKLDEFIRMAETLIRTAQQRGSQTTPDATEMPRRPARVAQPAAEQTTAATPAQDVRRPEPQASDSGLQLSRPQVIRRGPAANSA